MISAFAERDAGLLPGRKLAGPSVEELDEVERLGELLDPLLEALDAVELAEHREILAHAQPMRQVRIGALEIDAMQHLDAVARHVGAEDLDRARASAS